MANYRITRIAGNNAGNDTGNEPAPRTNQRLAVGQSPLAIKSYGKIVCGIVTPSMGLGGAEQWVCSLLHATDPDRILWKSVAVTDSANESARNPAMVSDAEQICPVRFGMDEVLSQSRECDVLIHWGIPYFEQYLAQPHCRTIVVSHGSGPTTVACLQGNDFSEGRVAVSNAAVMPYMERSNVVVIPNAADARKLKITIARNKMRAELGIKPNQKAVCYLGRLSPEKNPTALADAIACLPDDWIGVAVGDGWKADEIKAYAQKIAGGRVLFPGMRIDVGNVLNAMDWGILPSIEEGCSIALLEFFSMKLPVVASPVGFVLGAPELVKLIPTLVSGERLAAALLEDERQKATRTKRVEAAYQIAQTKLTLEAFGRNWTNYILKIANTP